MYVIGKNNKYLRDTKGGVKVESYSIKKFKVGAASVVIGASIFFGAAGVASASEVGTDTGVERLNSSNDEKADVLNNKISAEKEVVVPDKKVEVSTTNAPTVNKDAKVDKVTEKQALDKTKLQTNIEKVEELLEKINKEKAPASTLAAIKIDLENAKKIFNSTDAELTQAEVDATAKKLSDKMFVLSSMPKANTPKKVVKEGENTIANTGSRDSRNNRSMGEGVRFRATTTDEGRVEGALINVKEYISEAAGEGSTTDGNRNRTITKTFMTAKYSEESGHKFITYDVYFQNDGKALAGTSANALWFYPPRDILYSDGSYPRGPIYEAYYERYRNNVGSGILSHNPNNFSKVGATYYVPLRNGVIEDSSSQGLWGESYSFFQFGGGPTRNDQRQQMLKKLENNDELNKIIRQSNGSYPRASYSHLLNISKNVNYAYKYHVKIRLRDNVTVEEAKRAGVIAATSKAGVATTATAAYVYAATGTRLVSIPDAKIDPIQGLTVTKTVGDNAGDPINPVSSGYVRHKNGGEFPGGMRWSWKNNNSPSTAQAGVFKYTSVARYQDGSTSEDTGSGSNGTVTLNVKPIKPTITASDVKHKKGLTNQKITVNVGTGVKAGSTVTLYDGTKVIGTGTTNGTTATITVAGALTGNPITAETKVNNNGIVISDRSNPVTPTDAPDNQAPTVKMTNPTDNNRVSVLTSNETNAPTTRIYRGATLNVPLTMYDNDPKGKVNLKYVSGLPKGVTFNNGTTLSKNGAIEAKPGTTTVTGKVAADAILGKQTVTFKVSDDQGNNVDSGNNATVKFNVEVVDLAFKEGKGEVNRDGNLVVKTAKGTSYTDSHDFITTTDGKNVGDQFFAGGMKFRFIDSNGTTTSKVTLNTPGKHKVKAAAYFHDGYAGTNGVDKVTNSTPGKDNEILNRAFLYKTIEFQVKPTAPTVTPETNGDVTVTPVAEDNVNTFSFTYNEPNNSSRKITATKTGNGWTLSNAPDDGVTIDKTTGKVTIKDRAIKDSDPVTAKSETNDHVESDPVTTNSKAGEKEPPKFVFDEKNTTVENGFRTVYVTPTESNNFKLGTVTDNSKKLIESRLSSKDNNLNDLDYGLSYEGKLLKTNNGPEMTAPKDIMITGTLDKTNKSDRGNQWTNGKEIVTRYYVATDAAGNELRKQDNVASNPTRVVFKVLTQAEKYVPQVGTQQLDKDITGKGATISDAEFNAMKSKLDLNFTATRGEVKINGKTKDLELTMKDRGEIKKKPDGTYYIGATIKYPDLSTEDIEIPLSKSDTTAPTATMDGLTLTNDINTTAKFVVFKGATFNPTIRVSDDKSNVTNLSVSGISNGTKIEKSGNWSKDGADVKVELGNATATNTATLGEHEGSVVVKDALNNTNTYKFKYTVVDVEVKETPKTVPLNTQLGDSHYNVKVVDTPNADGSDKYYPAGMSFKWKKGTSEVANETELAKPGVVTDYKALVKFPNGEGFRKSIDGKDVRIYAPATVERPVTFHVKPTAPTITPLEKGDVIVTPVSEENVNTFNFTYVHPNNSNIAITATKNGNKWSLSSNTPPDGVTINPDTGVVTIKDRAIKDATAITANSVTTDRVESDPTTENSKVGDTVPPKFEFTPNNVETKIESGDQVVYVTPTEETNLTIGRVTDDSNKLTEVRIALGQTFNIGLGEGLSYNEAVRKSNVELDAPRNVTISGKLGEYNTGNTKWADTDKATRYVVAKDGATNELNDQTNNATNKSRVIFKVLTQATKYEPQITTQPINVDVTAPNAKITPEDLDSMKSNLTFTSTRGTVKISNSTTDLRLEMKDEGVIKQNAKGTYYVGATITYPDHSTEDIEIPVTKADANVPSATMDGMLLTNDENTANFVVFKGAKFNPTFKVSDDRNNITKLKVTGLPNGSTFEQTGNWTSGSRVQVTGDNYITTDTSTLGEHEGIVEVTDSLKNTGTYKFKYKVVDVEVKNSPETVELGAKLVDAENSNNGKDSHNYVKLVSATDGTKQDVDDKYYPAGMHFKWSKNHAEVTATTEFNKPGVVTDYKALVKFPSGAGYYTTNIDGKAVKVYTPASIEKDVTFHVAPPKPTFNQDTVTSTTRTISGTLGGFTSDDRVVEVHLNDKDNTVLSSKNGQVTINGDTWTATLPDGVKLRQSENKNGETAQPTAITVVNKVGDTPVSTRSDDKVVKMGNYSPSATIAGSKHIDVTVPHDAKRLELRFHNNADTDNKPNSIVLVRNENGGNWQVDPSTAPADVTNANNFVEAITNSVNETNKAENKVSITLKESDNNKKLLIKEETASGDNTASYTSGLGLRVDYKPEAGQNATPAGNWQVISVSNDAPVVTLKDASVGTQENPKVYTAGTTLTEDLLKELVTVTDTEDDSTTDKPFGAGKVNVISGLPANPTAGVYAVTLQPVDSQGKEGNQVTVHVVVKEQKPAVPTISQWQNGNVKVTPSTNNGGDKVTIPLTDGTVTLVKKDSGWELETPKEGLVFHNGSLEIPKELVGNNITAKATKGTNGSAVDSDDATYTPQSHTVTKVDIVKEADSPLSRDDLSGKTGVTGVVDGTEAKDFTAAKITSVVEKSPLPTVTPDSKHTIPVTITYEDGSTETTDVIVKVKPQAPTVTPKENGSVEITPVLTGEGTTTITYTGEDSTPQTVTVTKAGDGTWTSSDPTIAVDANGKVTIPADKVKDGSPVTAKVTSKTTDLTSQSSTETAGKPLEVAFEEPEKAIEKAKYTSKVVVTPNKSNSTITAPTVNGLTVNSEGKVTGTPEITDWDGIEDNRDVTIKVTVTHEGDTPVTKDIVVNVLRDTDGDGDPDNTDLDDDNDGIPDEQDNNPKVADKLIGTVNPPEPVKEKAEITPVTVVTSNKPGSKITQENPEPVNGLTVNGKGELTGTPKVDDWGKDEEERQIKIPVKVTKEITGKEPEEISVKVPVTILRDTDGDGEPDVTDKDDDNDGIPDEEEKKNGTDPKVATTQTPTIGITRKENGDAIVTPTKPGGGTYPAGTKVVIPGDNNTTIEVEIGNDGSGTVPNDKLPKTDKPGTGTVTEPNKAPSKPVNVTTPARKPSTIELEQDPKTGDVTVTPKKPDGTKYPSGTKVEIPGKNAGTPIVVTIGEDGTGKVSNDDLPEDKNPGTGTITEKGKDPEEVKVETPKRIDPTLPETDAPTEIAIARKDNGDAIVTPKKPGGGTYPPETKVEIPGEDGKTIEVTIGNDGSGTVPNDSLPKNAKPGTGTVTEPNKKPSQPVNVTTPARKTPTVELEQNQKTGDVTVTPKKPGGGTYPPGTIVEIPGKDGNPIRVEIGQGGKGTVPNSELPDGNTPGTAKITEPNKPVEEIKVVTPARKTPTVELKQDPDTGEVTVTPKKPDGSTYPSGTKVEIPGKNGTPIVVTIGEDGKGKVPNKDLPDGKTSGPGTITEPGDGKTPEKVTVETPARLTPALVLDQDPNTGDVTVTPKKPDGTTYPPGTTVEIPGKNGVPIVVTTGPDGKVIIPNKDLPDGEIPGTGKITPPGKPSVELEVKTPKKLDPNASQTEKPEKPGGIDITRKPNGDAVVTPKRKDETKYPSGTKVVIPGDHNTPIEVIIGEDGSGTVPNDKLPKGDLPGKGIVTEPNKRPSQPVDVTTPARKTPTVELEQDPSTGDVTVTPKRPDGSIYPPGTTVEIPGKDKDHPIIVTIREDGKGKVPNKDLPEGDVPGTGKIIESGKPDENVNVTTPSRKTPTVKLEQDPDSGDVTVTPKKPDGTLYPENTKVEIPGKDKNNPIVVIIGKDGKGKVPNSDLPDGEVPGNAKITEPGKDPVEVPVVTTPARKTPTVVLQQDPNTGDVTVTPKKPDGSTYPPGTKVEIPGKDKDHPITIIIGEDGKGKVPNNDLPDGEVPGTAKITEPGKPTVEVNVKTPKKLDPNAPQTEQPGEIEIKRKPNGDAIVTPKKPDGTTYPPGTKVVIPGDNNTPIEVTIGDNGSGEVPNERLPKGDLPGKGIVTEPNKRPSKPVDVTTPARKTPTVELEQDPNTGDVTVTPKKPDGSTYPPGTKVEIPGKNGTPIVVIIGQDGKGTVPNNDLPDGKVPGTAKITEPGKPTVEVPVVTTPAKLTPTVELEQDPNTGDVTVTPKKPDGTIYPPGTKVEIPGKNGNTITVIIGQDGKGKVPNSELPDGKVPGVAKITEPGKPTVEVPVVTTPAKLTPTVELEQDPKTGDVTVTPKKPDGSTYPPGTKVEIPGKNGNTITVIIGEDGKGKVPNSKLPDGKVPGVAKITEPGKPTVEVPVVITPAKLRISEKGESQSQKSLDNKENPTLNKSTKRLANTGESETNTGLAGLGLAMLGSLLAVAKRRRKDEE